MVAQKLPKRAKVGDTARKSIEFVNDDDVDSSLPNVLHHRLQLRTIKSLSGFRVGVDTHFNPTICHFFQLKQFAADIALRIE
ncbi:MAG TPA: hypothetical protein VHE81_19825 [Lacipirellulaceae bacterium]|nr:hypothetical protein [Lacipirellulaceae bacterium]